jgi:hypothetical protein
MSAETDVQAAEIAASAGITPRSIKATLTEKLQAQHVDVEDISGMCRSIYVIDHEVPCLGQLQVAVVKLLKLL